MSTMTLTGYAPTETAYQKSVDHRAAALPALIATMFLLMMVAFTGVVLSNPLLTILAGFCTVLTALTAVFSLPCRSA